MNKTENIFNETVKTLTDDVVSLQQKFHKLQECSNIKGSIDCLRLLKDTLSLIKEYDWHLEYSEYRADGKTMVSIWEQNHCGDTRNHKIWNIYDSDNEFTNRWYDIFDEAISSGQSFISSNGEKYSGSGKSYTLARLCHEYNGIVVHKNLYSVFGIDNAGKELGIRNKFVHYRLADRYLGTYQGKIVFIDENSGLTDEEIDMLKKKHVVVGFK